MLYTHHVDQKTENTKRSSKYCGFERQQLVYTRSPETNKTQYALSTLAHSPQTNPRSALHVPPICTKPVQRRIQLAHVSHKLHKITGRELAFSDTVAVRAEERRG